MSKSIEFQAFDTDESKKPATIVYFQNIQSIIIKWFQPNKYFPVESVSTINKYTKNAHHFTRTVPPYSPYFSSKLNHWDFLAGFVSLDGNKKNNDSCIAHIINMLPFVKLMAVSRKQQPYKNHMNVTIVPPKTMGNGSSPVVFWRIISRWKKYEINQCNEVG